MKSIEKILLLSLSLFALASCTKPKISVTADFTTDKEVYELYEDIKITNTSVAINDIIVACKWDWGTGYKWGKQLEDPISFDTVGEKEITLTAVTNENVSGTCTKIITIQDTNKSPVPDFEWTPAEGIVAGDEVQFTDKSADPDGSVVAWEWKIGASTVAEQNPKFTFNEFGDIEVTLTVTDNQRKKASTTKTIHVAKSPNSLELAWAKPFDNDSEAYTKFTSPATNADGSVVYAFSSGLHLVAFDPDGNQKWVFDANLHNPNPRSSDGTKTGSSCTPSVDTDGTVFLALAYNESGGTAENESGVYAINPDGTQKWYFPWRNAKYINVIPVILDEKIFLATKSNPTDDDLWEGKPFKDNGAILNKATGSFDQVVRVKRGSHGGFAATKEETILVHTDDSYGTRLLWKEDGQWKHYGADGGRDKFMLGFTYSGTTTLNSQTTYMAIDGNNRVYVLYGKSNGGQGVLMCYDLNKFSQTDGIKPEWTLELDGNTKRYSSLGVALDGNGTVYVTTHNGLTAVDPDGTKKWFLHSSSENFTVWGSPAVDNQGYAYFNESEVVDGVQTVAKLVKVKPDGTRASEIALGTSLRTSPTISPDGTIYCTGMKDGKVTLFSVKGSATGPATGWSQLGGNSRKSCKAE
jgi:hypothetical protein